MRHLIARPNTILMVFAVSAVACGGSPPMDSQRAMEPKTCSQFTDITEDSGVDFLHRNGRDGTFRYPEIMGGGVAIFDADEDGWLDIYLVNGNGLANDLTPSATNALFRNQGDGTFKDVTQTSGVGDPGYGQGCCVADFDHDGDQDLYVTNYGPDRFFINNGNATFIDGTEIAGIDNPAWGQTCAFIDADNDGWLDLYVQNYLTYDLADQQEAHVMVNGVQERDYLTPRVFSGAPDILYHNNRDGTFTDISAMTGIDLSGGKGMGAAAFDFDADGDTDLFVANDGMVNFLLANAGDGTFKDVALATGVASSGTGSTESSMGADVGDVDGDGRLDLVVPVIRREVFTLYLNQGKFFRDASTERGLARATAAKSGFSPNLFDADHDGDLDLFVSCGDVRTNPAPSGNRYTDRYGIPDILLVNDGSGHFNDVSDAAGPHFGRSLIGRGSAHGDLDNDGDLDLVISNLDDAAVVLSNTVGDNCSHDNHNWLIIKLQGTTSNRDAIGARIEVDSGGGVQTRLIRGGGSYLSVSDRRAHFGLGSAKQVESVKVYWPSGQTQTLTNIEANQFLTIIEPSSSRSIIAS